MNAERSYTLFTTVNRADGTDFDMARREATSLKELTELVWATVNMAEGHCLDESTFPPSSIILTVVPH